MRLADEHHLVDGCLADSAEHWRNLYEAMGREVMRQRDQISIMARERKQWERDVHAAVHRAAWQSCLLGTGLYLKSDLSQELGTLAFRLDTLPERLSKGDLVFVRDAARDLRQALERWDIEAPNGLLAELRRLRAACYEQGRRLHEQYGASLTGDRCACPGCELTRVVELWQDDEVLLMPRVNGARS